MMDLIRTKTGAQRICLDISRKWLVVLLVPAFWAIGHFAIGASKTIQGSTQTIAAEKFVVVDRKGNERAQLAVDSDGQVALVLWSKEKSATASLQIDNADMPRLVLENSKGNGVVDVGILRNQSPIVLLRDAEGNRRMALIVKEDGTSTMQMFGNDEKPRSTWTLDRNGNSEFLLAQKDGKLGMRLTIDDTDGCVLELKDKSGNSRIFSHVDANGNPELGTVDATGKIVWSSNIE